MWIHTHIHGSPGIYSYLPSRRTSQSVIHYSLHYSSIHVWSLSKHWFCTSVLTAIAMITSCQGSQYCRLARIIQPYFPGGAKKALAFMGPKPGVCLPNSISIGSSVFTGLTLVTNRHTDRQDHAMCIATVCIVTWLMAYLIYQIRITIQVGFSETVHSECESESGFANPVLTRIN